MTKAELVQEISTNTGIDRAEVLATLEAFMNVVRSAMERGEPIYLRTFGTFDVKKRAQKYGRNMLENKPVFIPAHYIPVFKPSEELLNNVKSKLKVAENG